jgi:hypothetical protein
VVIAGGGPSGIAAAISAARQGVKVLLLERYGILGGMLISGQVNLLLGSTGPNSFLDEIISLIQAPGQTPPGNTDNGREVYVDLEGSKTRLLEAVKQSGAEVYLQTTVIETVKEEGAAAAGCALTALVISTPTGPAMVRAKTFVDATGDGFIAFMAGAPFKTGREDGRCQPTTLEFCIEGVDETKAITCFGESDPVTLPDGTPYLKLCADAHERGELPKNVSIVRLHPAAYRGERNVNATQANGYDTLTLDGIIAADYELRQQIPRVVSFLNKHVPGYEHCRVKFSASTLGVRETRRITGEYMLSDADVEGGASFDDAVVHDAWYLIDIHNPTGGGQAEKLDNLFKTKPYDIPYRCLLPLGVENLLTTGRCISGTHRAHASYRVMGIAAALGQAAGIAAALSSKAGIPPRKLEVKELQKALQRQGVGF